MNEQKKQLKKLIEDSKTLTYENREALLKHLDILSEQRVGELLKVFEAEKENLAKIEEKYRDEEAALASEYLQTVKTFKETETKKANQRAEKASQKAEQKKLKKMMEQIEKVPAKKRPQKLIQQALPFESNPPSRKEKPTPAPIAGRQEKIKNVAPQKPNPAGKNTAPALKNAAKIVAKKPAPQTGFAKLFSSISPKHHLGITLGIAAAVVLGVLWLLTRT